MKRSLASDFLGSPLTPAESKPLRTTPLLTVDRLIFPDEPSLAPEAFASGLRLYLDGVAEILTIELQITRIKLGPAGKLDTRVRYELVATGSAFYREQRTGIWELQWQPSTGSEYKLHRFQCVAETRARCASPVWADLTSRAFGRNSSYSAQLLHGVDYWRTVLDGACGIDIYGHNGVSAGDIDGDGFDDLYVCQPAGLPNRLFRNNGDGTFDDITQGSGVDLLDNTACALFADFDNDGKQDLLVVRATGPLLFLNQGNGKFRQQPNAFHFASPPQGAFTGAALADSNRDGWLDIYFCLYVYYQGAEQYKYPTPYFDANNGPPNFLMRNNRDGTFRDATAESGLNQNNTRYSFCCAWTDCNQDGSPDLYVANDFGRKNLYRNNGDGTFTDIAPAAGVEDIGAGMSVSWFDYNNDGAQDLYVADMWTSAGERITAQSNFQATASPEVRALYQKHAMGNSLFQNQAHGVFKDTTRSSGTGMGRWSWSSDAWDFDHDGYQDLYVVNGMVSGPLQEDLNGFFWRQVVAHSPDQTKPSRAYELGWTAINELLRADYSWSGYERNVFYANHGDGTFSDVSGAIGLDLVEDGRAFALADFDHDGRLEVLIKNRNAPQLRLLKNIVKDLPASIAFRLRGVKSNRDAIGATVTIETSQGRQTRMLQAGSGFLCQHSKEIFFGLADAPGPVKAVIHWPSGFLQTVNDLPPGHRVWIDEGAAPSRIEAFIPAASTPPNAPPQPVGEPLPATVETWLLAPVAAPETASLNLSTLRGKAVLLYFGTSASTISLQSAWTATGIHLLTVTLDQSGDTTAIYNLLYRSLFDRHRDLSLPTAFLLDRNGDIVKIYQGSIDPRRIHQDFHDLPRSAAQRLAKALPFPSASSDFFAFGRNYLSLGSAFFQRGYVDQAGAAFLIALTDDPASAEAHYGLGSVYLKQDKPTQARTSFEQATQQNSGYPDTKPNAWNNLGLLAVRQGRMDDAVNCFENALRLNPEHLISLENLGNAYRQQKRWTEARATLEKAVLLDADAPEANYSLGMVYAQLDEPDRAYDYLQKALRLRPLYPEAMNNLGILYLRTHRRDDAAAQFRQCIQAAPAFDQAYLNLARVYAIEGDRDQARAILNALLRQHPGHMAAQKALEELH